MNKFEKRFSEKWLFIVRVPIHIVRYGQKTAAEINNEHQLPRKMC